MSQDKTCCSVASLETSDKRCLPMDDPSEDTMRTLIKLGADVNMVDNEWARTPLHWAAINGKPGCVSILIEAGANVEARDWAQHTPLHMAACSANQQCISYLLKAGACVDAEDCHQWTPLHHSVLKGDLKCIKMLVEAGGCVNKNDCIGDTPLSLGQWSRNPELQTYLRTAARGIKEKE